MSNNGDTQREFMVGNQKLRGLGSFHKTLPHNSFGEVDQPAFQKLVDAAAGTADFTSVPKGVPGSAPLANPQAGLAHDQLTRHPAAYSMPPAPKVLSVTTAAEMTELYWMALLRDMSFDQFNGDPSVIAAAAEIKTRFTSAVADNSDEGHLRKGVDVPGSASSLANLTAQNVFRMGLPGEEEGPMVSQFFLRNAGFGTQTIDQAQLPYKSGRNYLTSFGAWLDAQKSGKDADGQSYSQANELDSTYFDPHPRYISTMRDLARFVNKDALHQAYFNATLLLLSGGAKWTAGNPYGDTGALSGRETGFGTLGGPHILALVSEVATRALKVVWNQKWQVNLRLRPEAYGGLVHVQNIGVGGTKRPYGLPAWVANTTAANSVKTLNGGSLLLPMAFTPGSPAHPAYGAGHATVAGACVTILKAYFKTFDTQPNGQLVPTLFTTLKERGTPYGPGQTVKAYVTGVEANGQGTRTELTAAQNSKLTIEGELNKLASNVAMGRSIGGVHWRTDNTRSLTLGEALAAQILADITTDLNEKPVFEFRTFSRNAQGQPKHVVIRQGKILVDGVQLDTNSSAL